MARSQIAKPKFWLRVFLGMGLAVSLAIAFQHFNAHTGLQTALLWVKDLGSTGIIAFVVIYNLATVVFVPVCLLTIGGGALYGLVWGSVYVMIAATLGAVLTFGIGRYLARGWVCQQLQRYPKFQAIDRAVAQDGLKIVLLTRLSPLFPFNLLNYAFGVTRVSLKDYVIGSLGMIPGTLLYVYMGALAGDLAVLEISGDASPQVHIAKWIIKIIGLLATVAVTVYITRIARRSLNHSVASRSQYDPFH